MPSQSTGCTAKDTEEEYDIIVIGSGIGGLSCASLLSKYGYKVKVFESHYLAGRVGAGTCNWCTCHHVILQSRQPVDYSMST